MWHLSRMAHTSLLIPAIITQIITVLVTIPTATGQGQCNNGTLLANESANYLTSPNYPVNYPSNVVCYWNITATLSSNVVALKVLDFYLEGFSYYQCTLHDYVALYDGDESSNSTIALLCGQIPDVLYKSTGNSMIVVFYSNSNITHKGFKFEYTSQDPLVVCGDTILQANETAKNLTSPDYPYDYPGNSNCQWIITSISSSKVVVLQVLDFYLWKRSQSQCSNDTVAIYDGNNTNSSKIQTLCGQISNGTFTSTGSSMTVVFQSDSLRNERGFKFEYKVQDKPGSCKEVYLWANEQVKVITTPDYPNYYEKYLDCQWHITTSLPSQVVVLTFLDLLLEDQYDAEIYNNDYDSVIIYDGNSINDPRITELYEYLSNTTFISSGRSMTIVFHSNSYYTGRGFKAEFSSKNKLGLCEDRELLATKTAKYITTPAYPNIYPRKMDCQWDIKTNLSSNVVVLKVLFYDVGEALSTCTNDSVTIYDRFSIYEKTLASLCGRGSNKTFISPDNTLSVLFHSNSSRNYLGFQMEYTSQDKSALCGDTNLSANETLQYLISPGYPYNFPNNMTCEWHITSNLSSKAVSLKLEYFNLDIYAFDTSCNFNSLYVYDGSSTNSPRIFSLCGSIASALLTSTGPSMTLVFNSDLYKNRYGFKLAYYSNDKPESCKDVTLKAAINSIQLSSPNYPSLYPRNTDCQWHIKSGYDSSKSVISVTFSHFSLDGSQPGCYSDYVAIYDGPTTASSKIALLCGEQSAGTTFSNKGRDMTIVFHSDGVGNNDGFALTYKYTEIGSNKAALSRVTLLSGYVLAAGSLLISAWISVALI